MKIVTVQIELGIDNMEDEIDFSDKEQISDFLNKMLYEDSEFFGDFGPENIIEVKEAE